MATALQHYTIKSKAAIARIDEINKEMGHRLKREEELTKGEKES